MLPKKWEFLGYVFAITSRHQMDMPPTQWNWTYILFHLWS